MYRRVLVPLDGSEFSECIVPHAKAVATGCQVPQVVLLGVVEAVRPAVSAYMDNSVLEQARRGWIADIRNYLNRIGGGFKQGGSGVETVVVEGNAAEEILDYAARSHVDLIMMSTHGRTGIVRWAVGSVTDRVLRHSTAPVMVAAPSACRVGRQDLA